MMRTELHQTMLELADAIAAQSTELVKLDSDITFEEAEMSGIEAEIRSIVANHTTDGKPTYSNEEKRKAAISEILSNSNGYKDVRSKILNLRVEREYARIKLQLLRDRFTAHKAFLSGNDN